MAANEPIVSGMAGRYASALYDLAAETGSIEVVQRDLASVTSLMSGSDDLTRLVRSPVFSAEDQARAMGAILDKAKIGGLAGNFIRLVASNRRLFALPSMIRAFDMLVSVARGETKAEVVSAEPLGDAHVAALKDSLKASTGKDVTLDLKVDPALIGGLTVKIGSRMIDASLRTKLQSIKVAMKEVG